MTENRSSALTRWLIAAIVLVVALIFVVVLVRRSAARSAAATEEAPYTLDNSAGQVFAVTAGREGQLVAVTNGGLQIFSPEGASVVHELMSFKQPGVTAGERAAAAYDIGAETLLVADLDGTVNTVEPPGAIISARMNSAGWLALVTEAPGYRAVVTVYDENHNAVYAWYSGTSYVLTAEVSEKGVLAVLCVDETGGSVNFFKLSDEDPVGTYTAPGELFADLCWIDGTHAAAIGQSRAVFLNTDGSPAGDYDFNGQNLYDYAREGSGYLALCLSQYRSGSPTRLLTLSPRGEVLGDIAAPDGLESVSAHGKQVLAFCGKQLIQYNQQLEEMLTAEVDQTGVRQALLLQSGRCVLVFDYSAQAFEY
ncbi:MAG: hypothetical protein IJ112_04865 [Oscillospiraceae bacterium]|nr:hypothetical protein [Oscillospiraceae bacterium]